ncbi:MAG TPA: hypothetical protein VIL46_10035 [Gemmataceae bacterium]
MWRLEYSGAFWAGVRTLGGNAPHDDRLRRPFPHRAHWRPEPPDDPDDEEAWDRYESPGQVDGTIFLGEQRDEQGHAATWLLVVNGPERGHVWADQRRRGEGIRPVLRRGPYSFLAWYEAVLDAALARIDALYRELAEDCLRHNPDPGGQAGREESR